MHQSKELRGTDADTVREARLLKHIYVRRVNCHGLRCSVDGGENKFV